jgi:hypothetical protein
VTDHDASSADVVADMHLSPRVFIDARCHCKRCTDRTTSGYRMVGKCRNCGVDALVLYRAGDTSSAADCPTCGNWRTVHTTRLATEDEVPVAYEGAGHGGE